MAGVGISSGTPHHCWATGAPPDAAVHADAGRNIDSINGVMREQIMGIRVVRAFVREDHETARFTDANAVLTDTSVRIGRLFILMGPIITMVLHLGNNRRAVVWRAPG